MYEDENYDALVLLTGEDFNEAALMDAAGVEANTDYIDSIMREPAGPRKRFPSGRSRSGPVDTGQLGKGLS